MTFSLASAMVAMKYSLKSPSRRRNSVNVTGKSAAAKSGGLQSTDAHDDSDAIAYNDNAARKLRLRRVSGCRSDT